MEQDTRATFSYAAKGPVVTIDPIASQYCKRFQPFCDALVEHLHDKVGGLAGAFNQSIGVRPRDLGRAVAANDGAAHFLKVRKKMDPQGRFMNPYFDEILKGVNGGKEARPSKGR